MSAPFRVGLTGDMLKPDGSLGFGDIGLGLLDAAPSLEWEFIPEASRVLRPDQIAGYDAILVGGARVEPSTLAEGDVPAIFARFGVGYDNVDVDACTNAGALLTITPDGVRRPVAVSAITFVLALSQRMLQKDRLTREGRWAEKLDYMGMGLTGRTLGVVGLGNIGRELFRLAAPFGMRHLAYDPHVSPEEARALGVTLVELDTLMAESDFVTICCALTDDTYHLIDGHRLVRMKPTAYLINVARGPIVDESALTTMLQERKIAGAGLDVFEQEPVDPRNPILKLDNVIVAPHALCWTDECFLGNGRSACESILSVSRGEAPRNVVNRGVLDDPRLQVRLRAYGER